MLYAGQSAQGSVTFFSDLEQLCVRMWTPWFIAWLLQCVSTYRQRLWSQNTSPPLCHTYQLHPPWHTLNGGHWAHGHMGTTGILTSSTVLRIEQTQCQIVSTVSRKHHHGIGWVVKHTGHVSVEKTLGYWGFFSNLKVSPLQCPVLPTVAAVKTV